MNGGSTAFSFTGLPNGATTLAPNTQIDVTVTYKPTIERPPGNEETAVLVANLTGVLGPPMAMISLKGRGIDRHVAVDAPPTFPPTFRNPGDKAPIRSVTVHNTGEAVLKITAVMASSTPSGIQLVDTSPVDIPGGGSHDFLVKFAPTTVASATGTLTLINNDNGKPMAMVTLSGQCIDRNLSFGPQTIDFGHGVIGSKTMAADVLTVTNMNPSEGFTIHSIELSDGSAFHIDNLPPNALLPPGAHQTFSITFEPLAPGRFETTARLLIDQDPDGEGRMGMMDVTISGDAGGSISIHGGGGCATGADARAVAALGFIFLLLRRRRRRRAVAIVAIGLLGAPRPSSADDVLIGVFDPTPATVGTGFQLESPEVGPSGSWVASGVASYATDLLVLDTYDNGARLAADHAIRRRTTLGIGGAYAFGDRFEAGLQLPVYAQRGDTADVRTGATYVTPAGGTALGDLAIHAKARLARFDTATFGAAVHVTLPTATSGQFTGVDLPTARLLGLATWSPLTRLALSASAGGILRKTSIYRDAASISQGSGLAWGAGASYRMLDRLWATAEVFGEIVRSGRTEAGMNTLALAPVEGLAGASYRLSGGMSLGVAVGRGLSDGVGAPALRGVVTLSYAAGLPALPPLHPEVRAEPEPDTDGDGIIDRLDRCPREPEDRDGFQDDDGCPDPDNDGDGIPDSLDKCPNVPETVNGIDDQDGCPEAPDAAASNPAATTKAAEDTFNKGRELMQQGQYAGACAEFEHSQALDPQFGTQYNLAGCYAKLGKLASAWKLYRDVAQRDGNTTRRERAADQVTALARRTPKLKLVLAGKPAGVQITVDGSDAAALIGMETPLDPGSHAVAVDAPGFRPWRKTVAVTSNGKVVIVVIHLEPVVP
jgi:hypothetical protein